MVKIAEPNIWRPKSRVVWEKKNGPIPPGYAVLFADKNRENFDLENLILVSPQERMLLSRNRLISTDAGLTCAAIELVRVLLKMRQRKKRARSWPKNELLKA